MYIPQETHLMEIQTEHKHNYCVLEEEKYELIPLWDVKHGAFCGCLHVLQCWHVAAKKSCMFYPCLFIMFVIFLGLIVESKDTHWVYPVFLDDSNQTHYRPLNWGRPTSDRHLTTETEGDLPSVWSKKKSGNRDTGLTIASLALENHSSIF